MDDRELLAEFVDKGAAGAFEALVGRYLSMVYGVAMREVGEHHLAEDVTQAVFALLAKKAAELRGGTVVAAWLFQTARYAARNAKKTERRRRFHEERAGRLREVTIMEDEPREEQMYLLDCAMARLGERDRGAVILRYYRRLEMAEVGKALGVSEGAARRRVERAVVKLRVVMGTAEGGGIVGAMGVAGAGMPAGIAARSLACAKGDAGFEAVRTLMKGALKMMFWAKMKVAAVAVAAVMVVGGAGTLTVRQLSAHEKEAAPVVAANPLEAMYRQLDQLTQMVRIQQESVDQFCKEHGIPRFREAILHEYDRLGANGYCVGRRRIARSRFETRSGWGQSQGGRGGERSCRPAAEAGRLVAEIAGPRPLLCAV